MKVYYSTDYVPGTNISSATLVDITSSFTLSPRLSTGYPDNFTNSGNYSIPAGITGNGFFIFEYVGSGLSGLTSTMQIDDIVVN
ncbi:MAG: choice-of-anchor J domain-containing protein [Flavobacterium sp.]|nr:choice-of-anchor J domain-containing protein [Flavobacterium sp.]